MIKYVPSMTSIVMEEIPGKVTLAISISNCRGNCPGCHSPELRKDIGVPLTANVIDDLLDKNFGVNCVLFLGEGDDIDTLLDLAAHIKYMAVALYSGRGEVDPRCYWVFDYIKVGPYVEKLGPLNKPTTNQRLYEIVRTGNGKKGKYEKKDITSKFWP
jgi:anaerobic ribonucleoside-triphosphate reductase activating protein